MQDQGKVVHSSIPAPLVFSVCLLDFLQNIRTIWTIIWILHVYGDLRSPASREVLLYDCVDCRTHYKIPFQISLPGLCRTIEGPLLAG